MIFTAPTGKPRFTITKNYTTAIYIEFEAPPAPKIKGELKGYELSYREHSGDSSVMYAAIEANQTVSMKNIYSKDPLERNSKEGKFLYVEENRIHQLVSSLENFII